MTDTDKQVMLTTMTGEQDKAVLSTYLKLAANKVCRRLYPFDATIDVVPDQHAMTQVEIAAYLLNKRGAEGESAHNENGISRTYEDGDVPPSLMRQIIPFAAAVGGDADEGA